MDVFTKEVRSSLMARVRSKDTSPEITIRRLLHSYGLRFRLHSRKLTGSPDIVLPRWRTVVFIHGCFWHGHSCKRGSLPKSNTKFWVDKIGSNKRRDCRAARKLKAEGWNVITIWECQVLDHRLIRRKMKGIIEL